MEFKGTKGKWYLQPYTDAYTNIIRCDNGKGFDTLYLASTSHSSNKEERYNGLLMSKAPEMLEMLNKIVKNYKIGNEDNFIMSNLIDKSEQLIKEATELN